MVCPYSTSVKDKTVWPVFSIVDTLFKLADC